MLMLLMHVLNEGDNVFLISANVFNAISINISFSIAVDIIV